MRCSYQEDIMSRRRWRSTAHANLRVSTAIGQDGSDPRPVSEALRFAMLPGVYVLEL